MNDWLERYLNLLSRERLMLGLTIALIFAMGLVNLVPGLSKEAERATGSMRWVLIAASLGILLLVAVLAYCLHLAGTRNRRRIITTGARVLGRCRARYEGVSGSHASGDTIIVVYFYNGLLKEQMFSTRYSQWIQPGVVVELAVDMADPEKILLRTGPDAYLAPAFSLWD